MKHVLLFLLVALFFTLPALAEEAFFAEEPFEASGFTGEEFFFEENGFFAEDDFFMDTQQESAQLDATLEETEAESRSLVWLEHDKTEIPSNASWANPVSLISRETKDGTVKLSWTHTDGSKPIKLPKNVYYIIYDQLKGTNPTTGTAYLQNPLQVAKTRKTSVTLKNQIDGSHTYFVRAEYIKDNTEHYGEAISVPATVTGSPAWKTIKSISVREECVPLSDYKRLYYRLVMDQPAEACQFKLTCSKGVIDKSNLDLTPQFDEETVDGKRVFISREMLIVIPKEYASAKNFKLFVTPLKTLGGESGKTKTLKLSKPDFSENYLKRVPVITDIERISSTQALLRWDFDVYGWDYSSKLGFEILDGSKKIATIFANNHYAYIPLSSPSKHKLSVRVYDFTLKKRGKASAKKAITIPKPAKDIPVITETEYTGGNLTVHWTCVNPDITDYSIYVAKNGSTVLGATVKTSGSEDNKGYKDLKCSIPVASSDRGLRILVEAHTENGGTYKSDMIYMSSPGDYFTRQELDR